MNNLNIHLWYMGVSENSGTPKSSILIGFSIRNHQFWGTPIFGTPHMAKMEHKEIKTRLPWHQLPTGPTGPTPLRLSASIYAIGPSAND